MGATVFRVALEFLVECLYRLLELIETQKRESQIKIRLRILWGFLQHLLEDLDRFRKLELGLVNETQSFEDFRLPGITRRGLLIDSSRARIIFARLIFPGLTKVILKRAGLVLGVNELDCQEKRTSK